MPSNSTTRTAVVVGTTGIVGRAIAAKLAELGGWRVVGVTGPAGPSPASRGDRGRSARPGRGPPGAWPRPAGRPTGRE